MQHNVTTLGTIFRDRLDHEPNLIRLAAESMRKAGISEDTVQVFLNDLTISQSLNVNPVVQQHRLNAYFNGQYLAVDADTSQERALLRSTVEPQEWLRIFDTYHAIKLKSLNLPLAW